jgi:benzoyl-CoA reductase/2-hydroxyglutaryl-CoA dehydratase subunit BcrC/BadD/HgdB
LEQWSGETIPDDSLTKAMAVSKDNNALLRKLMAIRAADPPGISGVEALQIIGASMFILKDEHNRLLTRFLEKTDHRKAGNGVRLFVAASPTDNLQFYEIVESCGATIVAENHCWGNGYIDDDFTDYLLDPLEALAEHYHRKSHCPRMFPLDQRVQYCVSSAVASKAQGVIFYNYEWDYLQSWEYPDELAALKKEGIPVLTFKNQKYRISDAERMKLQTAIDNFVKSIHSSE